MSLSEKKPESFIHKELLNTEIKVLSTLNLFDKMYNEGAGIAKHLDILHKNIFKDLEKKVQHLSTLQDLALEKAFLPTKSAVLEARKWIESLVSYYKLKEHPDVQSEEILARIEESFSQLDLFLKDIDRFLLRVKEIRRNRLSTDFNDSIRSLELKMSKLIFKEFEEEKEKELPEFQAKQLVYEQNLLHLQQIKQVILDNRDSWEEQILKEARSLYIYSPDNFPYPFLYTKDGSIYVTQEVKEHLIGYGGGKYITVSFEMQNGTLWALVRPRTKMAPHQEVDQEFRLSKFVEAWRESLFLRKLKGAEGIIQLQEALVFPLNNNLELFSIYELFHSQSLDLVITKAKKSPHLIQFSKEDQALIGRQVLKAVCAIHKAGIIHRDIKVDNLLVNLASTFNKAESRIIDFNSSCYENEHIEKAYSNLTMIYCPPECASILIESNLKSSTKLIPFINYKFDMWSVGCIFYILFFQRHIPWNIVKSSKQTVEENWMNLLHAIVALKEDWIAPEHHSHPLYPLIKQLLSLDPLQRPTAEEALELFEKLIPSYQ